MYSSWCQIGIGTKILIKWPDFERDLEKGKHRGQAEGGSTET
jgi:hypothetical protein